MKKDMQPVSTPVAIASMILMFVVCFAALAIGQIWLSLGAILIWTVAMSWTSRRHLQRMDAEQPAQNAAAYVNIDEAEMRAAVRRLDQLKPAEPSRFPSAGSTAARLDTRFTAYTPADYAEIARYARSREPNAPPPAWRNGPEEFPLAALNRLGRPPRPPVPSHAITAAENAGHDLRNSRVLAIDIGLLIYSGGSDNPAMHREAPIADTVDYVQPFVELWFEETMRGTLRLMLIDPDGVLRFVSETACESPENASIPRRTFLSPTRLPIGDHLPTNHDGWLLRVELNGRTLAEHRFDWYDPDGSNALVEHMAADGELTVDLAALVEQVALAPLSLDDLLNSGDSAADVR